MQPIFITGIGTNVGKTVIAAIITEALQADYWKPVQAGFADGTDSEWVKQTLNNNFSKIHTETYKLKLAASPHIAAREEGIKIELDKISDELKKIQGTGSKSQETRHKKQGSGNREQVNETDLLLAAKDQQTAANDFLVIEGAGGLLVPLNENEFVVDLIKKIHAKVILVSRNYLGSINHSLLTALVSKQNQLDIIGWIFNDQYLEYEDEIVHWSGFPKIASVPFSKNINKDFIIKQANTIRPLLLNML